MIKHGSIIPLIGGETLGSEKAFGSKPEFFLSYKSAFWQNDQHIVNYYGSVPYLDMDKGEAPTYKVDVIGSVCPCAGLSMMHHNYGDHNENNKWLIMTTEYVLSELKPQVLWGENAPGFAGKIGANIRNKMYKIGRENGYSMTVYRTKSLLHGVPQVRERSFYFFWKGDKVPLLNYYKRKHTPIEQVILSATGSLQIPINKKTPSADPYYKYILEEINGGISHAEFAAKVEPSKARGNDSFSYIEKSGRTYLDVGEWMANNGFPKEVEKCKRKFDKLAAGGSIMRRGVVVPKDYIGAFVGHYPTSLTHPIEDRFITYREGLAIMGHPSDFELLDYEKNANHICQNVPVQTATDMATEIKAVLEDQREWVNGTLMFQYNHAERCELIDENKGSLVEFI